MVNNNNKEVDNSATDDALSDMEASSKLSRFFLYLPTSGIAPCVGTAGTVHDTTLDLALLCSSKAGADLGRASDELRSFNHLLV